MSNKPHRLKRLRLDELSLVDRPANKAAKVAIWKRDFSAEERRRLADEGKALPDGSFPIVNRADLQNAIQAFGRADNKAQVARHIDRRARALGATDMLPEEGNLANLIGKNAFTPIPPDDAQDEGMLDDPSADEQREWADTANAALDVLLTRGMPEGEARQTAKTIATNQLRERASMSDTNKATHSDDMTDAEKRRMRELMDKEGMSEKDARNQAMREMRKQDDPDAAAGSPGKSQTSKKGGNMTPEELEKKLGDLEGQVAELQKERDSVQAERDALKQQAHDHGLSVEKADDGSVTLTKAADDEVVTDPDGNTIRKSEVGAAHFKVIKSYNDRIAKMEAEREAESLRKRADAEVPHLKGTADERAALLKAVDGIQDEQTRKAVQETIKAADAAAKSVFSEVGKSAADDENSATYKLNKRAKEEADKDGTDFYTAYAKVSQTEEGRQLIAQSRAEQAN